MFPELEEQNERIKKAEENTLRIIYSRVSSDYLSIERYLDRNYRRYRDNNDLLPDQKTKLLYEGINRPNISDRNWEPNLNSMLNRTKDIAARTNREGNPNTPNDLNDPVDFWRIDSNNRINDWGEKFSQNLRGIIQLAYAQKWSKDLLFQAVRKEYGTLRSNIKRVVTTSTVGVSGQVSDRYAQSNNREYVILKTVQDDRVCPFCAARDGNVYRVGEISVPLHPSCRCSLVPTDKAQLRDKEFLSGLKATRKESLRVLKEAGGKPNNGVSPFEKKSGATDPPKPIWDSKSGRFGHGERKNIFDDEE